MLIRRTDGVSRFTNRSSLYSLFCSIHVCAYLYYFVETMFCSRNLLCKDSITEFLYADIASFSRCTPTRMLVQVLYKGNPTPSLIQTYVTPIKLVLTLEPCP